MSIVEFVEEGQIWELEIEAYPDRGEVEKHLNERHEDGWELDDVIDGDHSVYAYFRRPGR